MDFACYLSIYRQLSLSQNSSKFALFLSFSSSLFTNSLISHHSFSFRRKNSQRAEHKKKIWQRLSTQSLWPTCSNCWQISVHKRSKSCSRRENFCYNKNRKEWRRRKCKKSENKKWNTFTWIFWIFLFVYFSLKMRRIFSHKTLCLNVRKQKNGVWRSFRKWKPLRTLTRIQIWRRKFLEFCLGRVPFEEKEQGEGEKRDKTRVSLVKIAQTNPRTRIGNCKDSLKQTEFHAYHNPTFDLPALLLLLLFVNLENEKQTKKTFCPNLDFLLLWKFFCLFCWKQIFVLEVLEDSRTINNDIWVLKKLQVLEDWRWDRSFSA